MSKSRIKLDEFLIAPSSWDSVSITGVTDNDCQKIAKAMKDNNTIKIMHLDGGKIGDHGAVSLAEALEGNSSLNSLNLDNNRIGDYGATRLRESFNGNTTLTCLNLENNNHMQRPYSHESIKDTETMRYSSILKNNHMQQPYSWESIKNTGAMGYGIDHMQRPYSHESIKDTETMRYNSQIGDSMERIDVEKYNTGESDVPRSIGKQDKVNQVKKETVNKNAFSLSKDQKDETKIAILDNKTTNLADKFDGIADNNYLNSNIVDDGFARELVGDG